MLKLHRASLLLAAFVWACSETATSPQPATSLVSIASDSLPPDTLPPDTLPPDTVPPDTTPPDTNPPPPDTIDVARIALTPASARAGVGDSLGFFANLYDRRGNPICCQNVSWQIGDSAVAVITFAFGQSAHLIAVGRGTTTLTAMIDGKQDRARIVVR